VDTHNNVYVLIDGEEQKYNVDRVSRVATLDPIERKPPSYPLGKLTYTAERAKRRVDTPEPRASRHQPRTRLAEEASTPAATQEEEQKTRRQKAPREDSENNPKTTFVVIKDVLTGRNWPGLMTTQGELQTVQLLAKHKRGQFQKIWYDPLSEEEEPKMIMKSGKPLGHEKWTVTPDATWRILQEKAKYSALDLSSCM
jgi:hypothetical protein